MDKYVLFTKDYAAFFDIEDDEKSTTLFSIVSNHAHNLVQENIKLGNGIGFYLENTSSIFNNNLFNDLDNYKFSIRQTDTGVAFYSKQR
jgi:hypothetical protein